MNRNCPPPGNLQAITYKILPQSKRRKTLEELALQVGLSESRLRALFKSHLGLSPKQYVKKIKMDAAAVMVRDTFLKVTEIATVLNADDDSHFIRDFKEAHGMTPTQYRKRHQQRSEEEDGT